MKSATSRVIATFCLAAEVVTMLVLRPPTIGAQASEACRLKEKRAYSGLQEGDDTITHGTGALYQGTRTVSRLRSKSSVL